MGKTFLVLVITLLCAELLPALPTRPSPPAAAAAYADPNLPRIRSRRKVGNVTDIPRDYLEDLLSSITTEDKRPKNGQQDPTDVWCFVDKDITEGSQREKFHLEQRCSAYSSYVFSWKTLMESNEEKNRSLPVQRGIIRAYMQAIARHLEAEENIVVNITAFVDYYSSNHSGNSSELGVFAGHLQVNVSQVTTEWIEVNITEGLQSMWPPRVDNPDISVILKLSVNCDGKRRKVPVMLENPAEIPLEQKARRERNMNVQPLLVVFFSDEVVKEVVKEERKAEVSAEDDSGIMMSEEGNSRRKRTIQLECKLHNFTIEFRQIGLYNILTPRSVNIRKCTGSCTLTVIKRNNVEANNHAKLMSSAVVAAAQDSSSWEGNEPVEPSCVPTRFSSVYLMIQHRQGTLELSLYTEFIAEQCGCR